MAATDDRQTSASDVWSHWLLSRDGGDAEFQKVLLRALEPMRDRILDGAMLKPNMTLLDVGSGDGLIAFGAIELVGHSLRVILTDISPPLLQHVEHLANERGLAGQCKFHLCPADKMDELWDESIDVVTTRAVLAYVSDKPAALKEFFRVLKPGGRISIGEPIFQDDAFEAISLNKFIQVEPNHPQIDILRLLSRIKAAQFPSSEEATAESPLTNFSERDLVGLARDAGFIDVHLQLFIDVAPSWITSWSVYLQTSPHPLAPTPGEILRTLFSDKERRIFEDIMRPAIESGHSIAKDTFAYLTAEKPGASARRTALVM